ncbi:MAG: transketolase [Solirubrobacterales bacterium]
MSTDLRQLGDQIRRTVLEQSRRANVGHIGSCLSIADILAALYGGVLDPVSPDDPDRDRFVLSKGHAVLSLYAALNAVGLLSREDLETYCVDGSWVGGHPEHALPGVEFSTGSLGHGLSMAAGTAIAGARAGSTWRVFALLSDAECNEGSTWEAAMFAAQHQLSRLVGIVDANGQQALGYTRDILDLEPLEERWRSFGWDVHEVDGHDPPLIAATIDGLDFEQGPPHMLIARTTFGKGVDFMQSKIEWHYRPLSEEQFEDAMAQVGAPAPVEADGGAR